ncbi:MAG: sensor histidine kinase [Planctomycetaceae bacterium]|nr:sensor histidine kinase [Planctomycetaceae bacterium]
MPRKIVFLWKKRPKIFLETDRPIIIQDLCKKYPDLADSDIDILKQIAGKLPLFSELYGTDMFIDCLLRNGENAVVVAEYKPTSRPSVISKSVVGEIVGKSVEPAVIRTLHTGVTSTDLKSITVEQRTVSQSAVPVFNSDTRVIAALVSEEPLERGGETHAPANRAGLSERSVMLTGDLLSVTRHINDAIVMFDSEWKAIHLNRSAREFYQKLGYMDEIKGMPLGNLILDRDMYDLIRREKQDVGKEIRYGSLTLHVQCVVINHGSGIVLALIISDLSELRAKDRELIHKSVAMQEIHHRIKNNLQNIASILRLQARRSQDEGTRHVLRENIGRILSIAATHEILAKVGVDCVEINDLLCRIRDNVARYGLPAAKAIDISVEGDAFQVMSSTANTVALVVNELLTNALEHAFTDRSEGMVKIRIDYGAPMAGISVEDDGGGFTLSEVRQESLGFGIVRALVKDTLGGELTVSSTEQGTRIAFTFSN